MYKVLFVCLGNICRSPLAEGVFNKLLKEKSLENIISCHSAGTANYHVGENPDPRTILVAQQNGIVLQHKGRQFIAKDFDDYNLIVAMDDSNKNNILRVARNDEDSKKVVLMRHFDAQKSELNVSDPWYGDTKDFESCYTLLSECCTNLLAFTVTAY